MKYHALAQTKDAVIEGLCKSLSLSALTPEQVASIRPRLETAYQSGFISGCNYVFDATVNAVSEAQKEGM